MCCSRIYAFLFLITLCCTVKFSLSCNGYNLKVNHVRNCVDNSIYKVDNNVGGTLDKDCNFMLTGCIETMKTFKTAKGKYTVKKPPMPTLEGELDFCEAFSSIKDDPSVVKVLSTFALPNKCPVVKTQKVCGSPDKKINISKYKNQLGLAVGTTDVKLEIEHDTGKTCVEINATLKKGKIG